MFMISIDYKSDEYHKNRHPEFINSETLTLAWSEFANLEYFRNCFSQNILEFGGGLGNNLISVAKNSNVWMIEPSELGRQFAEKFGIKVASSLEELNKLNKVKFDIILCRHVLEHVDNPLQTLIDLKSLLKKHGKLILVLPVEKQIKPQTNEIDFHLYCWTPRTAINLLKAAKYEKINWKYNFFTGKKLFYPVFKMFGTPYYRRLMKMLGRILNAKELVIECN